MKAKLNEFEKEYREDDGKHYENEIIN